MKKNILKVVLIFCCVICFFSCTRKSELLAPTLHLDGLSYIKIFQASPNLRLILGNRDSFNIYANNVKVNGNFFTYNTLSPTVTNLYTAVVSGNQTFRITVNGVVNPDSLTFYTFNKVLEPNAYYSYIITDSLISSNESKQIWIKDNFTLTDTTHFTLRLIDAVINDAANIDVYSIRNASNIFSNISPTAVTPFNTFNYTLLSDTLIVRTAGTLTEIGRLNGVIFNRGRPYTILYKGQHGITGTKSKVLTSFAND